MNWDDFPTTATPLADISAVKLLQQGYSVPFGASTTMQVNKSAYHMLTVRQAPRWRLRILPWLMRRRIHALPWRADND
jgi:hypothetical protein